ncbi:hypothetical protein MHYP_G00063790 [Metynnis hypsauchen]
MVGTEELFECEVSAPRTATRASALPLSSNPSNDAAQTEASRRGRFSTTDSGSCGCSGVSGAEHDAALIGLSPLVLGDGFTSRVGSQTHAGHTPHYRNHNTRARTHAHQPGRLCCDGMEPSPQ